jgi:membrane protease YdiL (CAAX protease family)
VTRGRLLKLLTFQELGLLAVGLAVANGWGIYLWQGWSWSWSAWGVVLAATAVLTGLNAVVWATSEPLRQAMTRLFDGVLGPLRPVDFPLVALLSGIGEEIAFRGAAQPLIGITLSSLVFAVLHIPAPGLWVYGLWALFASLFLGNLYAWTGNLFVPVAVHVLNNLISLWLWHRRRQPAA